MQHIVCGTAVVCEQPSRRPFGSSPAPPRPHPQHPARTDFPSQPLRAAVLAATRHALAHVSCCWWSAPTRNHPGNPLQPPSCFSRGLFQLPRRAHSLPPPQRIRRAPDMVAIAWGKKTSGARRGFERVWALADKLRSPVNKQPSNKLGAEAFWPTTLDKVRVHHTPHLAMGREGNSVARN